MRINIVNVLWFYLGFIHCLLNSPCQVRSYRWLETDHVRGIARQAKTGDFSIDVSTALDSVFTLFKQERTSSLAHHKAATILVKWARSALWLIVKARR